MIFRQMRKMRMGMGMFLISGLVFSLLIVMFGISCQAPAPSPAPAPQPAPPISASLELEISGFAFVPPTVTVSVGTTVTWTNNDSVAHTVTTRETLFDSGTLSRGAAFSYTFEQSGTFEYYCKIHPSMTGKVIVE